MLVRGLVVMTLVACGPVKGNPPGDDAPADAGDPGFEVAVLTSNPNAPIDGRTGLELKVTRLGGFAGEIEIKGVTPPNGLEVDAITVPGDQEVAEVPVGATTPLAIGDKVTFKLEATAAALDAQQVTVTDAEVTGKPGTADVSFGPAGTGFTSISYGSDDNGEIKAIEILNGNLIVNGSGTGGLGAVRMSTARFSAGGIVDSTFNSGAFVRRGFGTGSGDFNDGIAIGHQFDGRPIMIGYHQGGGLNDFALSRLSTVGGDGGVDFGGLTSPSGRALIDLAGGNEIATDGLVLADNRTLIVGSSSGQFVIALATASGGLDTSAFGNTGFVREALGTSSTANAVVVDSADRFVVAGTVTDAGGTDLVLARYTAAGLDTTFGTNGRVVISTSGVNETAVGVAVVGDQIILGSTSGTGNYQARRFSLDGVLDTSFGTAGLAETTAGTGDAFKMVVLRDKRILFLGDTATEAQLVRFTAAGKPDPFFGTNGLKGLPFGDAHTTRALTVFDAHRVIVGGGNSGGTPGPGTSGVMARLWM